jgi:hypothetical protein
MHCKKQKLNYSCILLNSGFENQKEWPDSSYHYDGRNSSKRKVDRFLLQAIGFIWSSDGEDLSQGNSGPSLDSGLSPPEYKLVR